MEFRMGANQPFARQRLPQQITELDVSIESEAVTQTARADAGARADSQAVTTEISFGSFRLLPAQRLLLDGNKTVQLGSRAFDILIALVERPSELVNKEELIAWVWPKIFVDPANLAVHISALRRALRDGRDGTDFLLMSLGAAMSSLLRLKFMVGRSRLIPSRQTRHFIIHRLSLIG
jgi:DNA-binding response OmpR family regulator